MSLEVVWEWFGGEIENGFNVSLGMGLGVKLG